MEFGHWPSVVLLHGRVDAESAGAGPPGWRSHAHRRPLRVAAGHGWPGTAILELLGPVDRVQNWNRFFVPVLTAVSVRMVQHLVEVRVFETCFLLISILGRLLQGLGADRGRRVLGDLGPDVGITVVSTAAVPVAVTAGAMVRRGQRLAVPPFCIAEIAALAAARDQALNFGLLSLPLRLDFLIAEALLGQGIGALVSVRRFDFLFDLASELGPLLRRLHPVRLERRGRWDVGRPLPLLAVWPRRRQVRQLPVAPAALWWLPAVIVAPELIPQAYLAGLLGLSRLPLVIRVFRLAGRQTIGS